MHIVRHTRSWRVAVLATVVGLTTTACWGDSSSSNTATTSTASTSTSTTSTTTTTVAPNNGVVCTPSTPCELDATGPGGGEIFYVSPTQFDCDDVGGKCTALEVALPNWTSNLTTSISNIFESTRPRFSATTPRSYGSTYPLVDRPRHRTRIT